MTVAELIDKLDEHLDDEEVISSAGTKLVSVEPDTTDGNGNIVTLLNFE
jgi:hypothetical protein